MGKLIVAMRPAAPIWYLRTSAKASAALTTAPFLPAPCISTMLKRG